MSAGSRILYAFTRLRRLQAPRPVRRIRDALRGARALEIGGPSTPFGRRHLWPLYPVLASVDNLDFRSTTIWSGAPSDRAPAATVGHQQRMIGEASDLRDIASASYDCVLASHVLEHLANPLPALSEWRRVVKPGGWVVLIVPHRDGTFDHRRPVTSLSHLEEDAKRGATEDDLTHLEEILRLHDLSLDPGAGDATAFEARARANVLHRSLHHHVFNTELAVSVVSAAGLDVQVVDPQRPFHIFIAATVPGLERGAQPPDLESWRRRSPFPSDRR